VEYDEEYESEEDLDEYDSQEEIDESEVASAGENSLGLINTMGSKPANEAPLNLLDIKLDFKVPELPGEED